MSREIFHECCNCVCGNLSLHDEENKEILHRIDYLNYNYKLNTFGNKINDKLDIKVFAVIKSGNLIEIVENLKISECLVCKFLH